MSSPNALLSRSRAARWLPRSRPARWLIGAALLALLLTLGLRLREQRADAAMMRADPDTILADGAIRAHTLARGQKVFAEHCAACHGARGEANQSAGVPDLTDRDHLYGVGDASEIEQIVLHGIRSRDKRGWNLASMPAYGTAKPYAAEPLPPLTPAGVEDMTQFLLALTNRATDEDAAARGGALYADKGGCWDCHQADARGDEAIGAPNLTDAIWLYGGSADQIRHSLIRGRAGASPAFFRVLTAAEARAVAVYVASLSKDPAREAKPR